MTTLAWMPLAQSAPGGGGGPWQGVLLMAAVLVGMYALVIYPQRKQQREHEKMLTEIQRGDLVVTSGGIHGKVTGITDDVLTLEIAERVRIKANRSAIVARSLPPAAQRVKVDKEKKA